jgi:hypothetical protein
MMTGQVHTIGPIELVCGEGRAGTIDFSPSDT